MKKEGRTKKKHKKNKREKKSKTTDVFNKKRIRGERNPKILGQKLKASKGNRLQLEDAGESDLTNCFMDLAEYSRINEKKALTISKMV